MQYEQRLLAIEQRLKALGELRIEGYNRTSSNSGIAFARGTSESDPNWRDKTIVIVRKPVDGDKTLLVREARYVNLPPKPCTGDGETATCFYEWYGTDFEVYPPMGKKCIDFDGDENTAAITVPPKLTTKFHRCHREHDAWVLNPPPGAGGGETDICLVHAPISVNGLWVGFDFIRVVHVKPDPLYPGAGHPIPYISAESQTPIPNPAWTPTNGLPPTLPALGYSIVRCWPGTNDLLWQYYKSTTGTAPNFTPTTNAVYLTTKTINGTEYIAPEVAIDTSLPDPALPAGDC